MKFCCLVAGAGVCLLAGSATAASDVSARHDGIYSGSAQPAPGLGSGSCPAFALEGLRIEQGFFRSSSAPGQPDVRGFITEEGYVTTQMALPGRKSYALDGRLENATISAGYIDTAENCYWIVRLSRQP